MKRDWMWLIGGLGVVWVCLWGGPIGATVNPYDQQVAAQMVLLDAADPATRAGAAEALGYLRGRAAAATLAACLQDPDASVRREAAMSLGWLGGREQVPALLAALADRDWSVRQAAAAALANLTALPVEFDALAAPGQRDAAAHAWQVAWAKAADKPAVSRLVDELADADVNRQIEIVRALGYLGGDGAAAAVVELIGPRAGVSATATARGRKQGRVSPDPAVRHLVQAGYRSLGRLGGDAARDFLIRSLQHPHWARYAADALGETGDPAAIAPLATAYPLYARSRGTIDSIRDVWQHPKMLPKDDRPGLDPSDRMYETPYAIAVALSRLPAGTGKQRDALRAIAVALLINLPMDFDGAVWYEPEAFHLVTCHLIKQAGVHDEVVAQLFAALTDKPLAAPTDLQRELAAICRHRRFDEPLIATWLPTLCSEAKYSERLLPLVQHENGWVRINAVKTIMFAGDRSAAGKLATILRASKPEASFGYFAKSLFDFEKLGQGQDELNDPAPRWREAVVRALGRLGDAEHVSLVETAMNEPANALGVRHAAALALAEMASPPRSGEAALAALKRAHGAHPYYSLRLVAREAMWQAGQLSQLANPAIETVSALPRPATQVERVAASPPAVVFIKGPKQMPNDFQIDTWRQAYSTTDSGPTYRWGRNLFRLELLRPGAKPTPLTQFADGWVADCEVSWDGKRIIFARRAEDDPWWHLFEMNADGTGLRQITDGPYHDVQPCYLPDGRIVFSTSRTGMRDEYHGYHATGLATMNRDGSDLRWIGFNLGRDNEPAVLPDGRILFSRLELFYSRLKTELTVQAVNTDGTRNVTLYGPERREFWGRTQNNGGWATVATRHRILRLTQPQPYDDNRMVVATSAGLTLLGPGRLEEKIIPHDKQMAVTTPFPLADGSILCAAGRKGVVADLGLYRLDPVTGKLALLYNDPATSEFEARPLVARRRPPRIVESPVSNDYTGKLFCQSAFITRDQRVADRGRYVRVIEGEPVTTRHETHTNKSPSRLAWKNHTGTRARVLGTVPLAADGSFFVEVPADRLLHVQVLDSDRQVVGNQLVWMYVRPGETRSCVGCHEQPDSTATPAGVARTISRQAVPCLPAGDEFRYRAKTWNKGVMLDEYEERTRTVHAVNLIGRQ